METKSRARNGYNWPAFHPILSDANTELPHVSHSNIVFTSAASVLRYSHTLNCPSLQFGEILNRCCANVWSQFENDIFLSPRGCELDFCLTCRQMVIKTNKENITKQKNPILIPHSISQIIVCLVEMSPEKAMLFKSFLTSFFLNHKYESWTKHIDWVLLEAVWGQGMGFYLKQAWD